MEVVAIKIPKLRFPNFQGDWKNKQLKEVGQIVNGLTYSPENINENGVLVLRSSNIQNGSLSFDDNVYVDVEDFNPVEKNDILICVRNGSRRLIGKNALITEDISGVAFGAFMTVFRSEINEFIFQLFSTSNYYKTIHQNLGATINSINNGDLKKFRFSFPSQEEQQKIATFLSSVDKKLTQLQKKKELLEQYKKGMMQKIFKQEIRFKDENGNDFPHWKKTYLGKILKIGSGRDYKHLNEGNIPVYGTGGYMTSVDEYLFNGESVGIGRKGTIDKPIYLNGKFWTVDTLFYTHSFNQVLPKFIYRIFQQINWQKYNEASGVPSLSKKTLEKIKVEIPSLKEQSKISNFLSAIDDKIDLVATEIDKAKKFKKGLLQQMFI